MSKLVETILAVASCIAVVGVIETSLMQVVKKENISITTSYDFVILFDGCRRS